MDELPEKTNAPNLPLHDMAWSNESMQSSKGIGHDLGSSLGSSTSSYDSGPGYDQGGSSYDQNGSTSSGRTAHEEREVGLALTDALADILSTEKAPRQRRNVS